MSESEDVFGSSDGESEHNANLSAAREPSTALEKAEDEDVFGSSGDEEESVHAPALKEHQELFGSSDDDEDLEDAGKAVVNTKSSSLKEMDNADSKDRLDDIFGFDDEQANENRARRSKTISKFCIPPSTKTLGPDTINIQGAMPAYLRMQSRPFSKETYNEDAEQVAFGGAVNVIRWRFKRDGDGNIVTDANGKHVRESNARVVKWSDGSFELIIGEESFNAMLFPASNSYGCTQMHNKASDSEENVDGANQSSCLNIFGAVNQKWKLMPSSVHSEAHVRMSREVSKKYISKSRLQVGRPDELVDNPEKEKERRIALENVELRKERKRKQLADGGSGNSSKRRQTMSARFLEQNPDEDGRYDSTSVAALKHRSKFAAKRRRGDEDGSNSSDEEDDNDDRDGEMDDFIVNDGEDGDEDDEEEEWAKPAKKSRIAKKSKNGSEDEEDDDEDESSFDDAEESNEESGDEHVDSASASDVSSVKEKLSANIPPSHQSGRPKRVIMDSDED